MDILIVEDALITAKLMSITLRKQGYDPGVVSNGMVALEYIRAYPELRVIVSDIVMPEMDGFELLHRIKKDYRHQRLQFVICSGLRDIESIKKAAQLGCKAYIVKPVTEQQLVEKVGRAFQRATGFVMNEEEDPIGLDEELDKAKFADLMREKMDRLECWLTTTGRTPDSADLQADLVDVFHASALYGASGLANALGRLIKRIERNTISIADFRRAQMEWDVLQKELHRAARGNTGVEL